MLQEFKIDELSKVCSSSLGIPVEISNMSIDKDKNFKYDMKILPFLNEHLLNTKVRLDILSEFDPDLVSSTSQQDNDYILHLLLKLKERQCFVPISFISYRGTLTKIAAFPYENRENVKLAAIKFNGNIFFWWFNSSHNEEESIDNLKNVFGGYRFEKLITNVGEQNIDDSGPLYQSQFLSAVKTKLIGSSFSHDLFYAGEVDCIKASTNKYVEIKSRIKRANDYALKRFCFLKWWLQSYLIGIETVVVGFKNRDFIVENVIEYDIKEFYRSVRNADHGRDLWNPDVCLSFLGNFLSEAEKVMMDFKESDICVIDFQASLRKVTFTKTNQTESPNYDFLPEWFRAEWIDK